MNIIDEACCTCARKLSTINPQYDVKTEKPLTVDRRLDCCGRVICGDCIRSNARFERYCPFCQIATGPSPLPQGLHAPPAYSPPSAPTPSDPPKASEHPPAYSTIDSSNHASAAEKPEQPAEDVLHFLDLPRDTIPSLALRYNIPADALRRKNGLYSDHLLAARTSILIPGEYYRGGVSLSPRPVEGEEEQERKAKVRRWMVACKVPEYEVALLYLQQTQYDLDMAVEIYMDDEKWERENPVNVNGVQGKAKARRLPRRRQFTGGGGLTGQL